MAVKSTRKVNVAMPLQIYVDEPPGNNPLAHSVYNEASNVDPNSRLWVDVGGFAFANNPNQETALATSGARHLRPIRRSIRT